MKSNQGKFAQFRNNLEETNFPKRHIDFTNQNERSYPKIQDYNTSNSNMDNVVSSGYGRKSMQKTRSTKQLLRSKKQSSQNVQQEVGKNIFNLNLNYCISKIIKHINMDKL